MSKKKKSGATNAGGELRESAHKIWLAGLGALAAAEDEGGKLFKSLVDRGEAYQDLLNKPVDRATARVKGTYDDVRDRTSRTISRVEKAFDEQLSGALHRVGVPSRREVTELIERVEELTRQLEQRQGAKKKTTRKKKTVKKATAKKKAKKAVTKKASSRKTSSKKLPARKSPSRRRTAAAR